MPQKAPDNGLEQQIGETDGNLPRFYLDRTPLADLASDGGFSGKFPKQISRQQTCKCMKCLFIFFSFSCPLLIILFYIQIRLHLHNNSMDLIFEPQ